MKRKALAIVLTLLMLVSVLPMGAFAASETDTTVPAEAEAQTQSYTDTKGHWAEKSIERWTAAKVLEGMGDNLFAPDDNLTRAQAMTIFSRLLNLTEKGDISKLEDVAADAWYAPYIETGYAYQIIKGTSDTTFDPSGTITREQFFSIFARATGIPGTDKLDEGKTFTDLDQISSWFIDEGTVYSMINRGYLNGYPDGSLQPKGNITRAEVAKVLDNAISDYITEDGTYEISGDGIVVVLAKNVKLTGNFNGHIVSSCPDSTLDLSGLTGTPYIYVLGDNTKIINAKPGTKVAVNPAADNVTVNGVKVAYDPYAPVSPYIVPAGGSGGGGGAGGSSNTVTLTASTPFGKFIMEASKVTTVSNALNKLAADTDGVKNAVQEALDRLSDKTTTVDGYTVSVNDACVITVSGPGAIDLDASMKAVGDEFVSNMDKAASVAGFEGAALTAWNTIRDEFNPYSYFTGYTAGTMTFLSADQYTAKVVNVLNALKALQAARVSTFADDLDTIVADGAKYGLDWSAFDYDAAAQAIADGKLVKGTTLNAPVSVTDITSANDAITNVLGIDIIGDPVLQAILKAGLKEADIGGDYTLTVVVE